MARASTTRRGLHVHSMLCTFGESRIDEGHYETAKPWRTAERTWQDARRAGMPMAIVFSDESNDSNAIFRWAQIANLDVSTDGTSISWTGVCPIDGYEVDDLVKISDGQPVQPDGRRYFSVVETPAFLQTAFRRASSSSAGAAASSGSSELAAPTLGDADHDPLAYEQVWRRLRRHQSAFRTNLLAVYERRCAISGADEPAVLEAAHIDPHSKSGDNRTDNGILLRADLHILFDMGLLRVTPGSLRIEIHADLRGSSYAGLHGQSLRARADGGRPDDAALKSRWNAPVERPRGS